MVKERLHEFGLKMEDIVAATTDRAGRMICCVHQLCFVHGDYLAVTDFLYAKQNLFEELEKEKKYNNTGSDLEFFSEEEIKEVDEAAVDFVETEAIGIKLQRFVAEVIEKVRTVVKMFCKSPLKDEILQKHIQAQLNTELKLTLDSKIRWNSFFRDDCNVTVDKCIRMALAEIETSTTITDAEIKILHDLIDVIESVEHPVDGLFRRNATLLTAERIHDFVYKTLSSSKSAYPASLSLIS